jgi:hypothetical protein
MPVDTRGSSPGGGGGDDWLGGIEELDWTGDARTTPARPRGTSTRPSSTRPDSREDVTEESRHAERHPDDAIFRRRRAVGLIVALAVLGGVIWLAVAAFGGGSNETATQTTTTAAVQPSTTPTTTPTTPTTPTTTTTTPPATTNPLTLELAEGEKLRRDTTGETVKDLQRALAALGIDPGPIDGDFGPLTEAAVVQFQQANNLDTDGVVGPKTAAAVNAALAELPSSSTG